MTQGLRLCLAVSRDGGSILGPGTKILHAVKQRAELKPTCRKEREPASCTARSCVPQLGPDTATYINIQKKKKVSRLVTLSKPPFPNMIQQSHRTWGSWQGHLGEPLSCWSEVTFYLKDVVPSLLSRAGASWRARQGRFWIPMWVTHWFTGHTRWAGYCSPFSGLIWILKVMSVSSSF